jgi:hypothetical protein
MTNTRCRSIPLFAVLAALLAVPLYTQEPTDPLQSAEGVVRELYDLVTFPAGTTPDWDRARTLFLPEAVVVLRGRTGHTAFSVEGFIQDFDTFIERANIVESGFVEEIVRLAVSEFHDIATVWVLYEPSIPGREIPPQQGVDIFSMVRRDGRWWIAAIVNDAVTSDHPVPEPLRGGR